MTSLRLIAQEAKYKSLISGIYIAVLSFTLYTVVYAFRKPFSVAVYHDLKVWGVPYQTLLVIAQVVGYMLSKFVGIKAISEVKKNGRGKTIMIMVLCSWLSLLGLAMLPPLAGVFCMMLNGFFLGFLWGVVFSYVEGRTYTDFIGAVMAVSFIFSGGFTRTVALYLKLTWAIPDQWIAFITGLLFLPALFILVFLLERIPLPGEIDKIERVERVVMNATLRKNIVRQIGWGLLLSILAYLFLTVMRDVRDNFMVNLWQELGYQGFSSKMAFSETFTTVLVLLVMAMIVFVKNHQLVIRSIHHLVIAGFCLAGGACICYLQEYISGDWWMLFVGLGLYIGYIPFNCIFFERMIAAFKLKGNVGFLMYFADAFGYLGSVLVVLVKTFIRIEFKWVNFYCYSVIVFSLLGIIAMFFSEKYFRFKSFKLNQGL